MKVNAITIGSILLLAAILMAPSAGEVPADDGSGVIHNPKGGKWGKKPLLALEHVRTIGDLDAVDGNYAFYLPSCVALDSAGDILILDSGNHRVQKFGPDGRYLASFGRKGQGPGEMFFPAWLDMDKAGNMYVTDPHNDRVQVLSPDGKEKMTIQIIDEGVGPAFVLRSEPGLFIMGSSALGLWNFSMNEGAKKPLPSIAMVVDSTGKMVRTIGVVQDFGNVYMNRRFNETLISVGALGETYVVYKARNMLAKYSFAGELLWRADREMAFDMQIREKGKIERPGNKGSVRIPRVHNVVAALTIDDQGRAWVAAFTRQLREEEWAVMTKVLYCFEDGSALSYEIKGNTELRTTDAYKLELFDADGALLGQFPLDVFVDALYVRGDRLFIVDKLRGARVLEYRIRNI